MRSYLAIEIAACGAISTYVGGTNRRGNGFDDEGKFSDKAILATFEAGQPNFSKFDQSNY